MKIVNFLFLGERREETIVGPRCWLLAGCWQWQWKGVGQMKDLSGICLEFVWDLSGIVWDKVWDLSVIGSLCQLGEPSLYDYPKDSFYPVDFLVFLNLQN